MPNKPTYEELDLRVKELEKEALRRKSGEDALRLDIAEHNLTEEKLRKSRPELRQAIEKSPVPMAITDIEGNIEHFNDKFIELFGWTTDDVRTPEEWWNAAYPDEEYRKKVQTSWEKAVEKANATGKEIEVQQWRLTCKNGDLREIEFKMVPVSEDRNVISMNDITNSKRTEEALNKLCDEMEIRVKERTSELRAALEKVQAGVSERLMAEEALRESEELHRLTLSSISDAVFITDDSGKFTFICPNVDVIFGYPFGDVAQLVNISDLLGDNLFEHKELERLGEISNIERTVKDKAGREHVLLVSVKGVSIQGGTVLYTCRDITERKKAEESLLLFKSLIDQTNDAIFISDAETGRILDANERAVKDMGYQKEELLNMRVIDFATTLPDDFSWEEHRKELHEQGAVLLESGHKRKDGTTFPVEVNVREVDMNDKLYNLAVVRDITERKRAEKELRKMLRAVEQSPACIVMTDTKGNIEYVNPRFTEITGYTAEEAIGQNPRILQSGEQTPAFYKELWETITSGNEWHGEFHNKKKNGDLFWENASISPVINDNGEITNFVAVKEDITGRKRVEEAQRKSEKRLAEAQKIARLGNWEWDIDNDKIHWSDEIYRIFGLKPQEFEATYDAFLSSVHPDDRELVRKSVDEALNEKKPYSIDHRIILPDGSEKVVHEEAKILLDETGQAISMIGTIQNITERKKAEEQSKMHQQQLLHADKMKSLGALVSGVAHEINNPNNFIMLNSQTLAEIINSLMPILEEQYDKQDDYVTGFITMAQARERIPELLAGIKDGSDRIQQTVKKLKNFARKGTSDYIHDVNINTVVKSAIEIVESLIRKSTSNFSVEYGDNLPLIKGNQQELEQVIINLITNSCQALPDNKRGIAISTLNDVKSTKVMVKVSDEGTGIPEDVLDNIMEPFVTTKRDSGGTGLGLSISFSIIQNHKGALKFNSKVGKGTEATITLPAIEDRNGKGGRNVK